MNTSDKNTCANCGEGSDVTNTCNKCKSVVYCNAACKKKYRHKHEKECERRVAELHDEKLFKQPPPKEDCPICFLRLPTLNTGCTYMACCGKLICSGCLYAVQSRATKEEEDICPFCRTPPPAYEDLTQRYKKRVDLNDAEAIFNLGRFYCNGRYGLPQNDAKALELFHRAAELGSADAYYSIGNAYKFGEGVGVDTKKAIHYWELAAMNGDVEARNNLGVMEGKAGNTDRALKHWMIAIKDGHNKALQNITILYSKGHATATKDDHANALRSYQAYLDEIKSDQRDEAAADDDDCKYY